MLQTALPTTKVRAQCPMLIRFFLSCLTFCLVLVGSLTLSGCGPTDEEIIRDGLTESLELLKQADTTYLEELAGSAGANSLVGFGIEPATFYATFLQGFSYSIDNVSIEKDNAIVTLTITGKNILAIEASLHALATDLDAGETTANDSEEETNIAVGSLLLTAVDQSPSDTRSVDLTYKKTNGTWQLSEPSRHDLEATILGY